MPITIVPPDQRVYAIRLEALQPEVVALNDSAEDNALYIEYYDEEGVVVFAQMFRRDTNIHRYWMTCWRAIAAGDLFISHDVEFYPLRRNYVS